MRISDWSSDVCSSDLRADATLEHVVEYRHRQPPYSLARTRRPRPTYGKSPGAICATADGLKGFRHRSEEHTSELQSLMRNSYAVLCLKTKKNHTHKQKNIYEQTRRKE